MIKSVKKVLALVLTFIVSISIALLIGEFIIRMFYPQITSPVQFFYDEKLEGVVPVPNQKGFKKYPGVYYYEYINNDIGMRDTRNVTDYQQYANRILCIGDSFTYGWGVNDNETFSHLLEKKINKDSIAVLNAGISGSGTDYVMKFLQVRGSAIKPNTIVYFYFDNDKYDNMANAYYHIENDSIITNGPSAFTKANAMKKNQLVNSGLYNWLSSHSQLFGLIRYSIGVIWNRKVSEANNQQKVVAVDTKSSAPHDSTSANTRQTITSTAPVVSNQDSLYHTYKYISGADNEAKKLGAKFLMFYIPSHISLQEWQQTGKIEVEQSLKKYCEDNQIDFSSFTGEMTKVKNPVETFYIPVDLHWNKKGHAVAADYLYQTLKQKGIVP